ncbi:MAG: hypothetical protein JST45_14070 [Bacteroidetes bacterium]|nr:hypothetical protein [Bacteroidota bacterium]
MTTKAGDELIQRAIREKRKLMITVKDDGGRETEVQFDPYIFGDDKWQRPFVWGIWNGFYAYRFYLEWITKVKLEGRHFIVDPNTVYYYASEEDHYERVVDPDIECQVYSHKDGQPAEAVIANFNQRQK